MNHSPMSAQKTKMMLTIMNISMAVSPSALWGELDFVKVNHEKIERSENLGNVAGDAVEDIDEDEEDGDEDCHPAWHAFRRNQKT